MSLRELFESEDERLLTSIAVSRPGKKAKNNSTFLCVVGLGEAIISLIKPECCDADGEHGINRSEF